MAIFGAVLLALVLGVPQDEDEPQVIDKGTFIIKQQDRVIGEESFTLTLDFGDYYLEGSAKVEPGIEFKDVLLVFGEGFTARQASMKIETPQGPQKFKLGFRETTLSGRIEAAGRQVTIQRQVPKNPVLCRIGAPFFAWIPIVQRVDLGADPTAKPLELNAVVLELLLQQQDVAVTLSVATKGKESVTIGDHEMELHHLVLEAELPQAGRFQANIWVDDHKRLMKITMPSERIEVVRGAKAKPAAAEQEGDKGGEGTAEGGGGEPVSSGCRPADRAA